MSTIPDSSQNGQEQRGIFQFSLRSLLLFTLFVALALTSVLMYWRLVNAEQELVKLRNIAGYLKVEDESQIYAIALDTQDQWSWKWRVFLPKGKKCWWKVKTGEIPTAGVPSSSGHDFAGIDQTYQATKESKELLVSFAVRKNIDNQWSAPLRVNGSTLYNDISEICMSELKGSGRITECLGSGASVCLSPNEPIVLLRLYSSEWEKPNPSKMKPGIIVWLEIVP